MKPSSAADWTARKTRTVAPRALATLLADWSSGGGPLYRQLAERLRALIEQGELTEGTRLPPERLLADALAVSRTTVVSAYDQLRAEGVLASRQGSGTWVDGHHHTPGSQTPRHSALTSFVGGGTSTVELLGAHLPGVPEMFDNAVDGVRSDLRTLTEVSGYFPLGLPALRRTVAEHLTRCGLPSLEEEVLITSGAQQATYLAAASLLRPGETVVLEDPTYVGAIDAFRAAGARITTVDVGPEGTTPAALRDVITRTSARLVYLIPTFQNPTGSVMPEKNRREIARLVAETQVPLIEDLALADVVIGAPPPPPIAAFAKNAPVLTVGSMSKIFWAGLRVGWVRGPEGTLAALIHQKVVSDMGTAVPSQCIAAHVLAQAEKLKRFRKAQVGAALERLTELVKEHLPGWTYVRPKGGLVVWLRMPSGDAGELAQMALRHGVSIVPGRLMSPIGRWTDRIRMPIEVEPDRLREGIERLGRAWQSYTGNGRRIRAMGVIV